MSNQVNLDRRSLFKGEVTPPAPVLLPPWSGTQQHFLDTCTRCADCIEACPENILVSGSGGFPTVNFKKGECTFCGDCVNACATGALQRNDEALPWQQAALVNEQCLTQKGVVCRSCTNACEPEAISFNWPASHKNINRGVASPTINTDLCNGCGACISTCPSDALSIQPNPMAQPCTIKLTSKTRNTSE